MQRMIKILMMLVLYLMTLTAVYAECNDDSAVNRNPILEYTTEYRMNEDCEDDWVEVINNTDSEEWIVHENGDIHYFRKDLISYQITIDGEPLQYSVNTVPVFLTTVDYSSAVNLSYYIAWRENVSLTAKAIIFAIGGVLFSEEYNNLCDY